MESISESQRDGMREPPNRDRQPTAADWPVAPGFPPGKPRRLRFSRGAAIGCSRGRQPTESSLAARLPLLRNSIAVGEIFRPGIEVANLRSRDEADTPSTSTSTISKLFGAAPIHAACTFGCAVLRDPWPLSVLFAGKLGFPHAEPALTLCRKQYGRNTVRRGSGVPAIAVSSQKCIQLRKKLLAG